MARVQVKWRGRSPTARGFRLLAAVCLPVLLAACAGMRPGYEDPEVSISSFTPVPSESGTPAFEIGLHIVNPNREPLELEGIAYTISVEGRDLVTGVGNDLPVIEGYGEGDVTIQASASVFEGLRLLGDLMSKPRESLEYEFAAKLDVGAFRPAIRVSDKGQISTTDMSR